MSHKEAEAAEFRVVQSQAHPQKELDVKVHSRLAVTDCRLRGARVEGSQVVGEPAELFNDDATAESQISRPLHENRFSAASENVDVSRHR